MNSRRRRLASTLSSIISDVLTLLFPLLHSDYNPLSNHFDSDSFAKNHPLLPPVLVSSTLLSTSAVTLLSKIHSRKRKRDDDPESTSSDESTDSGHVKRNPCRIQINPDSFKLHFKMSSSTFEWLSSLLEPLLDCRDPINAMLKLSPDVWFGIGLRVDCNRSGGEGKGG